MTERNTRSQSDLNSPDQESVRTLQCPPAGLRGLLIRKYGSPVALTLVTRLAVAPPVSLRACTRTRPCHTGTRARPRLSTPAIFHRMPTAARRPAAVGYPLACRPSRYPLGQAGNDPP
jgi:hypothetical protein